MKIEFEKTAKTELFENFEIGECFVIEPNKPSQIVGMRVEVGCGDAYNAIDLQDGEAFYLDEDEEVFRLINVKINVDIV